ncbi:hypothetical protein QJQ45_028639, partial [Haematococcus lacustris]
MAPDTGQSWQEDGPEDTRKDARGKEVAGMSRRELSQQLHAQLKSTGVIGNVKSSLRAQLLQQLQHGNMLAIKPSAGDKLSLKRRALNSMVADYLRAASYQYSLSIFTEESHMGNLAALTDNELLDVLHVENSSTLHYAIMHARNTSKDVQGACFLTALVEAIAAVGQSVQGSQQGNQTASSGQHGLQRGAHSSLASQLDHLNSMQPTPGWHAGALQGLEQHLALYRAEIEEQPASANTFHSGNKLGVLISCVDAQGRAEVARQVERIRGVEVPAARLEEGERMELERLHSERLAKLRAREEESNDKIKRQQREVESIAFEHRQRILREEERLRTWRAEASSQLQGREEQLKHLERALELRERAVAAREAGAERRIAEAAEAVANAQLSARSGVEKEYLELKASLNAQRMQLEVGVMAGSLCLLPLPGQSSALQAMQAPPLLNSAKASTGKGNAYLPWTLQADRARIAEQRAEAAAEMAGARGKEERLKTMQVARMEAEARAAAHAAEAEIARMQVERLQQELAGLRDDVGRRVAAAADNAEAMLSNAAGALGMLENEAHHTRSASSQLQTTLQELASVRSAAHQAAEQAAAQLSELKAVRQEAEEGQARLASMKQRLADMESMVEEALAARATALSQLDDQHFSNQQLERDLADSRAALARAREELNALHASTAAPGGLAGLLTASGTPAARAAAAPLGQPSWVSDMGGAAAGLGLGAGGRGGGPAVPPLPAAATRALEQGEPASPIKQRLTQLSEQEAAMAAELAELRRRMATQQQQRSMELGMVTQRLLHSEASPPPAAKTMSRPHGLLEQGSRSPAHSRPATAWGAPSSALDPPLPVPLPSALQPGGASGLPRLDHTDTLALAAYEHSVPAGTAPQQHQAAALPQAPLPPHPLLNTQQAQQDQVRQEPAQQQWLAHRDGSQHWPQPQSQQWQQEQRPQASMFQPATGPMPPLPPPPAHAPPSLAPYLEPTVASVSFSDIPHPTPLPKQLAPPPASSSPQPAAATAPTILLQPTSPQPALVTASSHPGNPTTAAPAPYPSLPGLPSTAQSHHPAQPGTAVPPLPFTTAALAPGPGTAVALLTSGSQAGSSLPAQQLGDAPAASGWAAAAGLAVSVGGSDVMGSTLGSTLPPLPPSLSPNTGARASGPPPGLMLVQDLSSTAPPALPTQPQAAESKAMVPPSLDFVRAAQEAKLRLLQQQRGQRLSTQLQEQEESRQELTSDHDSDNEHRSSAAGNKKASPALSRTSVDSFHNSLTSSVASGMGESSTPLPLRMQAAAPRPPSGPTRYGQPSVAGQTAASSASQSSPAASSSGSVYPALEAPAAHDHTGDEGQEDDADEGFDDDDDLPSDLGNISVGEDSELIVGDGDSDAGLVPRPQASPWGRWLNRDTHPCLKFQRIGESMQRSLELYSWTDEALRRIGKEYQQGYKRVNDRLPNVTGHLAAEYRPGPQHSIGSSSLHSGFDEVPSGLGEKRHRCA